MCNCHEWGRKADLLMNEIRDLIERAEEHLQAYPGGINASSNTELYNFKQDLLRTSNDN